MELLSSQEEGVILSPSLYWYVQKKLPTKSLHKAKRYAVSLLNDAPAGYTELILFKKGAFYEIYAYDPTLLQKAAASFEHPMPFYALQQFITQLPARINKERIAVSIADIAVELPDEKETLPPFQPDLSHVSPLLKDLKNRSTSSTWVLVTLIFLLTAILFDSILHWQRYKMAQEQLEKERTDRTLYEIKALIHRYKKIENSYRKKRSDMEKILQKRGLKEVVCDEGGCRGE